MIPSTFDRNATGLKYWPNGMKLPSANAWRWISSQIAKMIEERKAKRAENIPEQPPAP